MEKTIDHCNISVDELDCKLVLVFHCKHGEERESERNRDKKERERGRGTETETERDRKGKREKGIKRNKEPCRY